MDHMRISGNDQNDAISNGTLILNHFKTFDTGLHKSQASKNIWKVLQVRLWAFVQIWWNIISRIYFWRNLSPGLLQWSSPQTKEGQRHSQVRLVGLDNSKTPLASKKYEPVIIERTIGIVIGPSKALYRSFPKHCTLTDKAMGTIWPPKRRQGPDHHPIVSWDSFNHWTCARFHSGRA